MQQILSERLQVANIPSMVITMGGDGSVYADMHGNRGFCPAKNFTLLFQNLPENIPQDRFLFLASPPPDVLSSELPPYRLLL